MARREMTVERFREIKELIEQGQSDRQIARALRCRRMKVAEIRRGEARDPATPKIFKGPLWAEGIDWDSVKEELGYKHALKFIWEEKAKSVTTYSNFWKVFYKKFPHLRQALSVPRDFAAGERVEVDWAGGKVEWLDVRSGEIHEAVIFVSTLGYSQLIFAWASEDMKSRAFLEGHRRTYEFFGGVPQVTVPDCTKTAVTKCHLYDPDINFAYSEMARFYKTAIVPARPFHPKDKALVELAVKLVMRYLRWLYRRHTFTSIAEINEALLNVIGHINQKAHTRFRVSRLQRFEKFEKQALKPLPTVPFESFEWKEAVLHPDCTVSVESTYYSAPHIHRGRTVQVRLSENLVEIFYEGERLTTHVRDKSKSGRRIIKPEHFPENAKAYYEATPQNLLSQARFLSPDLLELVVELFNKDTFGYLRIVQGFIRKAKTHINQTGREPASTHIAKAIATMRSYHRFRVPYFHELLEHYRKQILKTEDREIKRKPGNPMLRYADGARHGEDRATGENRIPEILLPITETINQGVTNGYSTI
jgi:transposase